MRRSFMPVRVVIHSSDVSRNVDRSALERMAGGIAEPQPVIDANGRGITRKLAVLQTAVQFRTTVMTRITPSLMLLTTHVLPLTARKVPPTHFRPPPTT